MNRNLRRGAVVVVTACVCLAAWAQPASAAHVSAGTATLFNSTSTSSDVIALGASTAIGTGCANSVTTAFLPAGAVTTWQITAYSTVFRFQLSGTGTWYIATLTRTSSTAGTVTGATSTSANLNATNLVLDLVISNTTFQSATDTSCATTTQRCRFPNVQVSLSGTYVGNVNSSAASHTVNLGGSGPLGTIKPPCSAPFTGYAAGTVTVAGLVPHL